jgi:DNA-binding transcriptional regulator YiaG
MAKKFEALRAQMSPESQARTEAKAQTMLAEMPLNELRQARGLYQKMLAEVLHVLRGHMVRGQVSHAPPENRRAKCTSAM